MQRLSIATALLVAFTSVIRPATAAAVEATCYDHSGIIRPGWKACDPSASTASPCCDVNDFCMSNGLCLNAGGNQAYTQQGCTTSEWAAPCVFYCPPGKPSHGLYYMEYCWRGFDEPKDHWCCGVGCCDNGTAISIPIAKEIYRPGSSTSATSSNAASPSASISGTQPVDLDSGGSKDVGNGVSVGLVLGIALGVGFPLLLVAAAFAWFFVRHRKGKSTNDAAGTGSLDKSLATGQGHGWYIPPSRQAQCSHGQQRQQAREQEYEHRGQEQWSPPSELEVMKVPVELAARNERY